jgi:hypothetical protein
VFTWPEPIGNRPKCYRRLRHVNIGRDAAWRNACSSGWPKIFQRWPTFLDDFQRHWSTDENIYVDFVRDGAVGNGAARLGNARWRRLTEERAGSAKSVFHFDVQGSVAKSTHSGIPWLRFIRQRLGSRVHFWPFDGWDILPGRSAISEVYPALWSRNFEREGRTVDQHDAYSIAAWLSHADQDGDLAAFLKPDLTANERTVAQVEGWILGVPGYRRIGNV